MRMLSIANMIEIDDEMINRRVRKVITPSGLLPGMQSKTSIVSFNVPQVSAAKIILRGSIISRLEVHVVTSGLRVLDKVEVVR